MKKQTKDPCARALPVKVDRLGIRGRVILQPYSVWKRKIYFKNLDLFAYLYGLCICMLAFVHNTFISSSNRHLQNCITTQWNAVKPKRHQTSQNIEGFEHRKRLYRLERKEVKLLQLECIFFRMTNRAFPSRSFSTFTFTYFRKLFINK